MLKAAPSDAGLQSSIQPLQRNPPALRRRRRRASCKAWLSRATAVAADFCWPPPNTGVHACCMLNQKASGHAAPTRSLFRPLLAAAAVLCLASNTGCLWLVSESIDEEHGCAFDAHWDGDECVCDAGFAGDPYESCDPLVGQSWQIADGCDDLRDIDFRFFSGDGQAVWPPDELEVFQTRGYDILEVVTIECIAGETICFGAASGVKSWGCGIENEVPACDSACYLCEPGTVEEQFLECAR